MEDEFSKLIIKLDNNTMYQIIKEIDTHDISISLKNQSNAVKEKIFSNVSKRAAFMIKEDMDYMNPESEIIKDSQRKIWCLIHKMAVTGEITITQR